MAKKEKKKKNFADIFAKYKTYDTSGGMGSAEEWKKSFINRMGKEELPDITSAAFKHILALHDCKTSLELRIVYKGMMKKFHPDAAGNTTENSRISQEINDEYNKLLKKIK